MLGFIYSVASYLGFLAVYVYFAAFSDGVFVPKSVDDGLASPAAVAVFVDLSLLLLFGIQHSVMARATFKRGLTRVVPVRLERATFVLVSTVTLAFVMWQWRPIDGVLWSVETPALAAVLWTLNVVGWLGVPACTFMIDHFDLFGLKQGFQGFRKGTFERKGFVTPLLYRYVRHPMMTSFLVAFWVTPQMTIGHVLLSIGMTLYIFVGVHFEERSLARDLGRDYARYQESTPRFLPTGTRKEPVSRSPDAPISGGLA